jgi:fructokinase
MEIEKGLVLGVGEVLWDLLPEGRQLGGAPANFAYHCAQLGAPSMIASRVGNDQLGAKIKDFLAWNNVGDLVQTDPGKPTGTVEVKLKEQGVPEYNIIEDVAWDFIEFSTSLREAATNADVVCFGSLAQRNAVSRAAIQQVLRHNDKETWRIFDINLRQHYYDEDILSESLNLCNVLKINDEELEVLKEMFGLGSGREEAIEGLVQRYGVKVLALTLGEQGSWLYDGVQRSFMETPRVNVVDTVGAGDSFTAAMAVGLMKEQDLKTIHKAAVQLSAFVCTQKGATPKHGERKFYPD